MSNEKLIQKIIFKIFNNNLIDNYSLVKLPKNFPNINLNSDLDIFCNNTEKLVRQLAEDNFEASYRPSNIVNNQKVINNTKLDVPEKDLQDMENYTYSTATEGFINNQEFLTNDQGIKVAPFFRSQPPNINFDRRFWFRSKHHETH